MPTIYLVRHGQASFLKRDYDQLSGLGFRQADELGIIFHQRNTVFKSFQRGSLNRHKQTADTCLKHLAYSEIAEDTRWDEYDHKELIGRYRPDCDDYDGIVSYLQNEANPIESLQQLLNNAITDWVNKEHEYSMPWDTFRDQSLAALMDLADSLSKGEKAVVFTSGGPITAIIIQLLGLDDSVFISFQDRLVNCSITKIAVGSKGPKLSSYNEFGHFDHDEGLITFR